MSLEPKEPAVGNRPGDPACPGWLLRLDDPAPTSVLFIGTPDPSAASWFRDRSAQVDASGYGDALPAPPPLVVLDEVASARGPDLRDPTWLAGVGAVVLACEPSDAWAAALAAAGLGTIRPVDPPRRRLAGRRPAGRAHVAVRTLPGTVTPLAGPPPAWLARVVADASPEVSCASWSLRVPSAYPSQKAVALVGTSAGGDRDLAVKVTRHPRFNERLENEAEVLGVLRQRGGEVATRIAFVRGTALVAGMAAIVQDAIAGHPFIERSSLVANCPIAADAVRAITDLGAATHYLPTRPSSSAAGGDGAMGGLPGLVATFVDQQQPPASTAAFLEEQVAMLLAEPPPTVAFHGDLGAWNLLVDQDDRVRILDWESAELHGPPLWDLYYFLRSFAVRSGRRRGLDRSRAIGRHLLGSSPIAHQAAAWVGAYCQRLGIAPQLAEPLFHTCWMHRAVKERRRLHDGEPGHYGQLCLRMVEHRDAPGLRRLTAR